MALHTRLSCRFSLPPKASQHDAAKRLNQLIEAVVIDSHRPEGNKKINEDTRDSLLGELRNAKTALGCNTGYSSAWSGCWCEDDLVWVLYGQ